MLLLLLIQFDIPLEITNAKFTFLNKIVLFYSNSTVSSVEILQMLKSIEFPLPDLFGLMITSWVYLEYFRSYFLLLTVVVLMSTFKNKNSLRTIEAEIS